MPGSVANPAAAEIRVPDPALVVLVGAAGAGKSTFAGRWFRADEILSSDALRAQIAGDPADQSASAAAFALLHRRLRDRLLAGRLTVVDATNVRRPARRSLLVHAVRAGIPAVAIVLDLPRDVVHARNAARRERVVEAAVIDRQLADLGRTLGQNRLAEEGFAAIIRVGSAEDLGSLTVRRIPAGA
jgi:protein phosphatase